MTTDPQWVTELLRSMTPVPFALGEEFASKWQFIPYVEKGLANFCRVDIINVGGFTETMKVRRAAQLCLRSVACSLACSEAGAQLDFDGIDQQHCLHLSACLSLLRLHSFVS